jgi:hypothetical protein
LHKSLTLDILHGFNIDSSEVMPAFLQAETNLFDLHSQQQVLPHTASHNATAARKRIIVEY